MSERRVRPLWRYRLLVTLLRPALWLWVALVGLRIARGKAGEGVPGGARRALGFVTERLGHGRRLDARHRPSAAVSGGATPGEGDRALRWLHAASVGEVLTALPLVEALHARGQRLLVTTATPSGAAVLARRAPAGVRHRFLPIDTPGAVARFLDQEQPNSGWVVETELWPTLFAAAAERDIPLAILSARLSQRTAGGLARWLRPVYAKALQGVHVLARSEADGARFAALGAAADSVSVPGDLKRAWQDEAGTGVPAATPASVAGRRYALAASTHEGEELSLADVWLARPERGLLVIVPRHPERADALERQLLERLPQLARVPRHGRGDRVDAHERLLLGDTFGELERWYRSASAAFIGGSLVPRGGHNLLEAARHGLPLASGPHTTNFSDTVAELLEADALQVVNDAEQAAHWLSRCLHTAQPGTTEHGTPAGQRALAVARRDAELLPRYLEALARIG